jgi:hypothetical protein
MIVTKITCDLCSKEMNSNDGLPYKFSTDNLAHSASVKLNENPSIQISSMDYFQYCSDCLINLIRTIAAEQEW